MFHEAPERRRKSIAIRVSAPVVYRTSTPALKPTSVETFYATLVRSFRSRPRRIDVCFNSGSITFSKPYKPGAVKQFQAESFTRMIEESRASGVLKVFLKTPSGKEEVRKLEFATADQRQAFVSLVRDLIRCGDSALRIFDLISGTRTCFGVNEICATLAMNDIEPTPTLLASMLKTITDEEEVDIRSFFQYFKRVRLQRVDLIGFLHVWMEQSYQTNEGRRLWWKLSRFAVIGAQQLEAMKLRPSIDFASRPRASAGVELLDGEETVLRVDHVSRLCGVAGGNTVSLYGVITVTNFRLMFNAFEDSVEALKRSALRFRVCRPLSDLSRCMLPLCSILRLKRQKDSYKIVLDCKDVRQLCFSFDCSSRWLEGLIEQLQKLIAPPTVEALPCSFLPETRTGSAIYSPLREYTRLGFLGDGIDSPWGLFHNADFAVSPTYPEYFILPNGVLLPSFSADAFFKSESLFSREELVAVCGFRSRSRVPAAVWRHPLHKCVMVRCSQPMIGLSRRRCEEDEKLLNLYRTICRPSEEVEEATEATIAPSAEEDGDSLDKETRVDTLRLIDARKPLAATGNQLKGKGVESPRTYQHLLVTHLCIENIHHMRNAWESLYDLTCLPTVLDDAVDWLLQLQSTMILQHVGSVLRGIVFLADCLDVKKQSCIVHCSDGWDRTAQLTSGAQLMLDPYYRTLEGFAVLIEKEWRSFGHKFQDRCGYILDPSSPEASGAPSAHEWSPVFLQWLDVVWQMRRQVPAAFEFSPELLLFIADAVYSFQYDTFALNTEQDRKRSGLLFRRSLWADVLSVAGRQRFTSPAYRKEAFPCRVWVSSHPKAIRLWGEYWQRFDPEVVPGEQDGQWRGEQYRQTAVDESETF